MNNIGTRTLADLTGAEHPASSRLPLTRWMAAVVVALGVLVLLGWLFDIPALRSILPGAVQMKANTAVALLLAGVSLSIQSGRPSRWMQHAGRVMALGVVAIGAATLCEYVFGWQLRIDELLFRDTAKAYNTIPGRMSPLSTVAFIVIGGALAALSRASLRLPGTLAAIGAGAIGVVSFLGYLWNASELTTEQWLPPVAINTALAFILLGVGTTLLMPSGPAPKAIGGRGAVELKVLIALIVALGLLCLGGGITYRMQVNFAHRAESMANAQSVRTLGKVYALIADAEAAQRNYLLTGRAEYRSEYRNLSAEVNLSVGALRPLVKDDPVELALLGELKRAVAARMQALSEHIDLFERLGDKAVREAIAADGGAETMESVRTSIRRIDNLEQQRSTARAAAIARDRSYTLIALLATLAFATAVLVVLFGSIVRDVRERARISAALDQAEREAQRATQAKSDFLAAMSHEIRTPMNGVIGMLDLLQQSSLMGQQLEMVNLIRESADSLLTIIDDILDFSKIEAGRLEIESLPLSVADIVEKTCGLLNRLAERKEVILTVFADPAIPAALTGDSVRLRQVLINLTGNAIKFCSGLERRGHVSVRAMLAEHHPDHVVVEFSITDNGIGIDDATQARLFTPFTQADASTTRRYGGSGLGLAISRRLADLMSGSIGVKSATNKGSTFTLRLPFAVAQAPADAVRTASGIEGLPCVVVGGSGSLADDFATYLASGAATVIRVASLSAARDWTQAHRPASTVWIIDGLDGTAIRDEVREAIRTRTDLHAHMVLVLIGRGQRNPRAEADGIIMIDGNALTRDALVKAVAIAAGRAPAEQDAPSGKQRTVTMSPPTRAEAIRQNRLILVAEDNEINQKVIRQQLNRLGYAADIAANGAEALELWRSGDYGLLLTDLHMPEMDGYDLSLAIRLAEGTRSRMPIVALTANALDGEAERCRTVGMDDYLCKPATPSALASMLQRWLPDATNSRTLATPASTPSASPAPVDVSVLKALVGTDQQLIEEFLQEFRTGAVPLAARLTAAYLERSCVDTAAIAHQLKSSARSVGALKLGDLCAAIEAAGTAADLTQLTDLVPRFEAEMAGVNEYLRSLQTLDRRLEQGA